MMKGTAIYAIHAAIALAEAYATEDKMLSSSAMIHAAGLPRHYGETVANKLRLAKLAYAHKGKLGGYRLMRAPEQISMADILRAADGPTAPANCVKSANVRCKECRKTPHCVAREAFVDAYEASLRKYESVSLADLLAKARANHGAA
ncbi:rrf2 family transcriptional regulator [alpha proteobacterium U9-1i]|nr:rrf2 family transcriptional regulator [alpha proteobacterium U9-1i]